MRNKSTTNGPVNQLKQLFILNNIKRTLNDVLTELPDLNKAQASMALYYLFKNRWLSRELIHGNNKNLNVYEYTYHPNRLPHPYKKKLLNIINPIEYYANTTKQQ